MNCETFSDLLQEYLDETLEAQVQAAAQEHLRQCDACRQAFRRQQALAKSLRHCLDRATAGLSVRPGMRQDVLQALKSEPVTSSNWWSAGRRFIPLRPAGAVATLLGLLLLSVGIQVYRRAANDGASPTIAQTGHYTCVINVPMQTQTHVFRRQDNTIEDAVISSAGVGYAGFFEDREPPSPKTQPHPL